MAHTVYIRWGELATRMENRTAISEYSFETEQELNAFLQGVEEGVGWLDHVEYDTKEEALEGVRADMAELEMEDDEEDEDQPL